MKICIIAAKSAPQGVIGFEGRLPWQGKLHADMQRFRALTRDKVLIMGRKTLESMGGPLKDRKAQVVISRNPDYRAAGVTVVHSWKEALQKVGSDFPDEDEVFVIGGSEIFRLALPDTTRVYMTLVHGKFEGDAFFPTLNHGHVWHRTAQIHHNLKDDRNAFPYTFIIFERALH